MNVIQVQFFLLQILKSDTEKNCAKQVQFICPGKKHHISISLFLHAVYIIFIQLMQRSTLHAKWFLSNS